MSSLCLLCIASFLQSSVSPLPVSNPGVSLKCNQTVEAVAGETATPNCTLNYTEENCTGCQLYLWMNMHDDELCNSSNMKYRCEWDCSTVSLSITNVTREEEYHVEVRTDCGSSESSFTVRVKQQPNSANGGPKFNSPVTTAMRVPTSILVVCLVLTVWD